MKVVVALLVLVPSIMQANFVNTNESNYEGNSTQHVSKSMHEGPPSIEDKTVNVNLSGALAQQNNDTHYHRYYNNDNRTQLINESMQHDPDARYNRGSNQPQISNYTRTHSTNQSSNPSSSDDIENVPISQVSTNALPRDTTTHQ